MEELGARCHEVRGRERVEYTYKTLSNVHRLDRTHMVPTINAYNVLMLRPSCLKLPSDLSGSLARSFGSVSSYFCRRLGSDHGNGERG